jgi:arylsulfatase A-like enzyme
MFPNRRRCRRRGGAYCGLVENRDHLPLEVNTLAEVLKTNGYHTAHIGKWHLAPYSAGSAFYAEHQGFDYVIGGAHLPGPPDYYSPYGNNIRNLTPGPAGEYLNERLAQESIQWISSVQDSGQPFYLNFWHYAVHGPIIAKQDLMPKYEALRDPNADQRCPEMATMLESMDTSIGMLLDWLDHPTNSALKANTLILLTSDNGGVIHSEINGNTWTSNRPLRGGKANTYEGGMRVPWIVRWPGNVEAGTTNGTPVQTTDIYPTVLEAAGIDLPPATEIDGQSLVSIFDGTSTNHQPIFTDFPHLFGILCAPSCTVRVGDYKLIRYYHAGENATSHGYELFDLERDPFETINLAAYLPAKVTELDALIEAHLTDADALVPIRNTAYAGTPINVPRSNPTQAPDRPLSVHLPEPVISTTTAGSRTIQLLDQENQPRDTYALVLEGSEWVQVENLSNGCVSVDWDVPPESGSAKVLFGWNGGATVWEINDWTHAPCVLLIGPSIPTASVADGSFEGPPGTHAIWRVCHASWNPTITNPYQMLNPVGTHFDAAAEGEWCALMSNLGTINQDLATPVAAGDTLSLSFSAGRSKDTSTSAGGGVFNAIFRVGTTPYSMSVNTSGVTPGTWQSYTHTVTVTNSGLLGLEFSKVSGAPWLDNISEIAIAGAPPPGFSDDAIEVDETTGQVTLTIETINGLQYRMVYLDDLTDTNGWQAVTPPDPDGWTNGAGAPISMMDAGATNHPQRFYRVEAKSLGAE